MRALRRILYSFHRKHFISLSDRVIAPFLCFAIAEHTHTQFGKTVIFSYSLLSLNLYLTLINSRTLCIRIKLTPAQVGFIGVSHVGHQCHSLCTIFVFVCVCVCCCVAKMMSIIKMNITHPLLPRSASRASSLHPQTLSHFLKCGTFILNYRCLYRLGARRHCCLQAHCNHKERAVMEASTV